MKNQNYENVILDYQNHINDLKNKIDSLTDTSTENCSYIFHNFINRILRNPESREQNQRIEELRKELNDVRNNIDVHLEEQLKKQDNSFNTVYISQLTSLFTQVSQLENILLKKVH